MNPFDELRNEAEQEMSLSEADVARMTPEEIQRLVHDMQVHREELSIQNEQLREAQAELAMAHDRYADLYEFAPVGYATLDAGGTILSANLTLATKLGVARSDLTGKPLSKFVARNFQDTFYKHRREVFRARPMAGDESQVTRHVCDLEMQTPSDSVLFVRLTSECVSDDEMTYCRTAISDVTTQKLAELRIAKFNEELEQQVAARTDELKTANGELISSQERLRMILDTAADSIITIDRLGIIQELNLAAVQMFGFSTDEAVGRELGILMPQNYIERHYERIRQSLATGLSGAISRVGEVTGQRKDGSTFQADLTVTDVPELGLFTGIMRDLTDQQNLQREVLSIADREQRRIGADLHDGLCQELAGIAMIAQCLEMSELQKPAAEQAQIIADGLKQATMHARDIAHGMVPVELDAQGLMAALTRLSNQSCNLPGIECTFECPTPVLIPDSHAAMHLYHIAQEACGNAVRHGSPTQLRIVLEQSDELGQLTILDDGCGIDESKTNQQRGGFGLRIMQYRAGLLGGQLTVKRQSATGGTTVTCSIPLKKTPSI